MYGRNQCLSYRVKAIQSCPSKCYKLEDGVTFSTRFRVGDFVGVTPPILGLYLSPGTTILCIVRLYIQLSADKEKEPKKMDYIKLPKIEVRQSSCHILQY
jgi:hypothetical protein